MRSFKLSALSRPLGLIEKEARWGLGEGSRLPECMAEHVVTQSYRFTLKYILYTRFICGSDFEKTLWFPYSRRLTPPGRPVRHIYLLSCG